MLNTTHKRHPNVSRPIRHSVPQGQNRRTKYRFYDPILQRWLNRDPLGEWGALNVYSFALNNPVHVLDALGLSPDDFYSCIDAAAIAACQEILQATIETGRERAGSVYQNDWSIYMHTPPNVGTTTNCLFRSPPWLLWPWKRANLRAIYHSHPGHPDGQAVHFSLEDKTTAVVNDVPIYVIIPSGTIFQWDPNTGDETIIVGPPPQPEAEQ